MCPDTFGIFQRNQLKIFFKINYKQILYGFIGGIIGFFVASIITRIYVKSDLNVYHAAVLLFIFHIGVTAGNWFYNFRNKLKGSLLLSFLLNSFAGVLVLQLIGIKYLNQFILIPFFVILSSIFGTFGFNFKLSAITKFIKLKFNTRKK